VSIFPTHLCGWTETQSTWLGLGDDANTLQVPDNWTLIKLDPSGSSHPEHGVFEMNSDSNGVGGSRGWRFDAEYAAGVTLASTDEIYFTRSCTMSMSILICKTRHMCL
jgi:hypothetical protein